MPDCIERVLVPVSFPGGGIRTYMIYNLKPLHKAGYRFTFLSAKGSVFDNFKNDFADCEGTEFIDVPDGGSAKATFFAIRKELVKGTCSIVHSQGLRSGTLTCAAQRMQAPFANKIPHIITLHDVIVPQNDIPGKFKRLKKKVVGFLTRRASVIIPVSNDCAENHLHHFPVWKKGPVKICPILNGIRINPLAASPPQAAGTNNITTFGFFGRFMPQKGFDVLLKALEMLAADSSTSAAANIRVLVTIDRHGYTNETLKEVENSPVLKNTVQFIESVPDITPLWKQIDALVMPSRWEACPILPEEALAAGVPVIGSDCLGLREVLAGTGCATPPAGNAQALADAMLDFVKNPASRQWSETELTGFRQRFDVNTATEKLLKVYQDLTENKK